MKWVPKYSQVAVCHSVNTCYIQVSLSNFPSLEEGQQRKFFFSVRHIFSAVFLSLTLHWEKTGILCGKWEILVKIHSVNQSKAEMKIWFLIFKLSTYLKLNSIIIFKTETFVCFRLTVISRTAKNLWSFIEASKLKCAQISLATKRGDCVYLMQVLYYNGRVYEPNVLCSWFHFCPMNYAFKGSS